MVGIPKYDRDLLRFLWLKNPNDANSNIEQFRFTRLVFGLRSSPAVLGAVISHHLTLHKESHPEVVDLIEKSLYVDDLISGDDNDGSAFHVYEVSKKVMSSGRFNLRKWNTNSEPLLRRIHDTEANVENRSSTTSNNSQSRSAILLYLKKMNPTQRLRQTRLLENWINRQLKCWELIGIVKRTI